jgi:hypothetical protein
MVDILFVHGTGVRLGAYDRTLSIVRKQAADYLSGTRVHPCLWGEPHGAKLRHGAPSIPDYNTTRGLSVSAAEREHVEEATWRMLGEDPVFEIRLLENLPPPQLDLGPNDAPPGDTSLALVAGLQPHAEFLELLQANELEPYWADAHTAVAQDAELQRVLRKVNRDPREVSQPLARVFVAALLTAATDEGHPGVPADTRSKMVDLLVPQLGGAPLGPFDWITVPLIGIAKRIATYKARRARRALSDASYPAAGDIVLYQARGDAIRDFIRERIEAAERPLVVVAHSLGGIACVELLIRHDLRERVKGLVTVGSQSPFFHEIGALGSLDPEAGLPEHFPKRWLNVWDPNDFLSYVAEGVFGASKVKDFKVTSRVSFPDSHSTYWTQEAMWLQMRRYFTWT